MALIWTAFPATHDLAERINNKAGEEEISIGCEVLALAKRRQYMSMTYWRSEILHTR